MPIPPKESVERHKVDIAEVFRTNKYVVFLCGPKLPNNNGAGQPPLTPQQACRVTIQKALEEEQFEVVLGEDEGLEHLQNKFKLDAQSNELAFIKGNANAVVLIAESPGALTELGLFSYVISKMEKNIDFILILDKNRREEPSYINLGPTTVIKNYGKVHYVDYNSFSANEIITRLMQRRAFEAC